MTYSAFISEFDKRMEGFIDSQLTNLQQISSEAFVQNTIAHIKALAHTGKRIRPYMMYLANPDTSDQLHNIQIGIELFHVFALIHDDIIDNAATRRGVPTIDAYIQQESLLDEVSPHIARSLALLVGDLVYAWAMSLLKHERQHVNDEILHMIDEVVIGQMLDVACMTPTPVSYDTLMRKIDLKTGGYTFTRPLRIGLATREASQAEFDFADTLGKHLGRIFQMQDDLLDIVGDPKILHKPILQDIQAGVQTLLTWYIQQHGNTEQIEQLHAYMGKTLSAAEQQDAKMLYHDSGAITFLKDEIQKEFDVLHTLEIPGDILDAHALQTLIDKLQNRKI